MESIFTKKFLIGKMIATGSSAKIYEGTNIQTNEAVTIKLERTKGTQLLHEAKVYNTLKRPGVSSPKWFGVQGDYTILVVDPLGPDLEKLFDFCGRKLSPKSVLMLADQMIKRVKYLHSKSYLHRNIEPENFLMSLSGQVDQVHVIDFGVAKKYRDSKTHQHIPYRKNKNFTGSVRFASVSAHLGIEQGRRDDLEALGYVLVYFLKGSLPWQNLEARSEKQKYEDLRKMKVSTSIKELCKDCPAEFASYFHYCRSLRFDDKPDYAYLRRIFRDLFIESGFQLDNMFDWTVLYHRSSQLAARPPRVLSLPGWNPARPGLNHVAAPSGPSWSNPSASQASSSQNPTRPGLDHVAAPSGPSWSNPSASQASSSQRAGPSERSTWHSWRSDKACKNFRP